MGAKNKVISGDYEGKDVVGSLGTLYIRTGLFKTLDINKQTVEHYEVLDSETSKSAASAVGRGALGAVLLGPIGLAAALSAKNKGVYLVALQFHDGKKSLLEIDDKIYKKIIKVLF